MTVNKKILCVVLALVLCLSSAIVAVSAEEITDTSNQQYKYKEIISLMGWEDVKGDIDYRLIFEYNADGTTVDEGATADYAVVFAHTGGILCWEVYEYFGNYKLIIPAVYNPGFIIYSIGEEKIYTIREAYNQNLPGMDLVLERVGNKLYLYRDLFEEYLKPYKSEDVNENSVEGWFYYEELYYYNSLAGGTTEMPVSTPDYVLADATAYNCPPANVTEVFGDYVVYSGWGIPNSLRYYVYTPKDNKIYTLREAYDSKLEGIMNVFTDCGLGFLLGDMDSDQKLTVKDATYLQKCLAKFDGYSLEGTDESIPDWVGIDVADFDLNRKTDIKDVTAIQKRVAQIEE